MSRTSWSAGASAVDCVAAVAWVREWPGWHQLPEVQNEVASSGCGAVAVTLTPGLRMLCAVARCDGTLTLRNTLTRQLQQKIGQHRPPSPPPLNVQPTSRHHYTLSSSGNNWLPTGRTPTLEAHNQLLRRFGGAAARSVPSSPPSSDPELVPRSLTSPDDDDDARSAQASQATMSNWWDYVHCTI